MTVGLRSTQFSFFSVRWRVRYEDRSNFWFHSQELDIESASGCIVAKESNIGMVHSKSSSLLRPKRWHSRWKNSSFPTPGTARSRWTIARSAWEVHGVHWNRGLMDWPNGQGRRCHQGWKFLHGFREERWYKEIAGEQRPIRPSPLLIISASWKHSSLLLIIFFSIIIISRLFPIIYYSIGPCIPILLKRFVIQKFERIPASGSSTSSFG